MIPASTLINAFPELDKLSRPENPYRGLEAFREKDAGFYFGRDDTIELLLKKAHDLPFVSVIGASGSGKSSVVFAGLVPALRKSGNWLIALCRPLNQPFYELSSCLIPFLYDDENKIVSATRECADQLSKNPLHLSDYIQRIINKNQAERFLLIIDQFEELYTLTSDKAVQHQFVDSLSKSLTVQSFTLVLTMRADFMSQALSSGVDEMFNAYPPAFLKPINEQGLKQAIEKPASLLNVEFESGLTERILKDLNNEPGNLPLLEFCLTQLWEQQSFRRLTHEAYESIGGVNEALARYAEDIYTKEFNKEDQQHLRHIFVQLVRPGHGTEDTRQVATLEQVKSDNRELITKLADKRLIVTGLTNKGNEKTVTIEVVHEALIRGWQTLKEWINEDRSSGFGRSD